MRISQAAATVILGALMVSKLTACSAGGGSTTLGAPLNGSSGGFGGAGAGAGAGASPPLNTGGDGIIGLNVGGVDNSVGGVGGGDMGACGISQKPEQAVGYSPVALYIMQDRSGSMITGFPEGSAQSWGNSTTAIGSFVNDPNSAGIDVGLGFFPSAPANAGACDGTECATPFVEIGPVATNAAPLTAAYQNSPPSPINLTPTECAVRGMIKHCEDWTAKTGEQCVAVLVTDGNPTLCDGTTADLAKIVADGKAAGVTTFTLGLPGATLDFLNQLAVAGGTSAAIDVSGGSAAFTAALNSIRGQVAVATALPCTWTIPPTPAGQTFDPTKVNVSFTPSGGQPQNFGYVAQADCAKASNAWYFDDPNNPKQVLVCPTTCNMLTASTGAEVDVSFGCARIPAIIK